jgi:hypothetical protein
MSRVFLNVEILEDRTAPAASSLTGTLSLQPLQAGNSAAIAAGDFDGDGIMDVAEIDDDSTVSVILGRGESKQHELRLAVGDLPRAIVAADFDGNGLTDLAILNEGSNDVSVLLGLGNGMFKDQLRSPTGEIGPDALIVGDFNGDGLLDLASIAPEGNKIAYLLGNGDGTFKQPVLSPARDPIRLPTILEAAGNTDEWFPAAVTDGQGRTQIGGGGAPDSAQTVLSGNIFQPLTSTISGSDDQLANRETRKQPESDILLTSFGIAVFSAGIERRRPLLADVFVINGPGFPAGVAVVTHREVPPGSGDGGVDDSDGEPFRGTPYVSGDPCRTFAGSQLDESALRSLKMVLDDLFRPDGLHGLPGTTGGFFRTAQPGATRLPQPREQGEQASQQNMDEDAQTHSSPPEMTESLARTQAKSFLVALLAFGARMGSEQNMNRRGLAGERRQFAVL